ncbi:hypothetical protein HDU97_004885 [Phlyctochytrium planicorne]|nr:hypothetical protein HDU97_004885 [Phlyctochytrium planicorne]
MLFTVFITLIAGASVVSLAPIDGTSCFTLPADSLCGQEFEGAQVHSTFATDLPKFNSYIESNSNLDTSSFKATLSSTYQCSTTPDFVNTRRQESIAFAASFACANVVKDSIAQGCLSSGRGRKALCKTSCERFVGTYIYRIGQNDCPGARYPKWQEISDNLYAICDAWGSEECFEGTTNEVGNCGFGSRQLAKEYCVYNTDDVCCIKFLRENQPPLVFNSTSSHLAEYINSYSSIRFEFRKATAQLCPREFDNGVFVGSCLNSSGDSLFSYSSRDHTIRSLATGRCMEARTSADGTNVLEMKDCITFQVTIPSLSTPEVIKSFKRQRWSVVAGVKDGFEVQTPVFQIRNDDLGECLSLTDDPFSYPALDFSGCSGPRSVLTFAGFAA